MLTAMFGRLRGGRYATSGGWHKRRPRCRPPELTCRAVEIAIHYAWSTSSPQHQCDPDVVVSSRPTLCLTSGQHEHLVTVRGKCIFGTDPCLEMGKKASLDGYRRITVWRSGVSLRSGGRETPDKRRRTVHDLAPPPSNKAAARPRPPGRVSSVAQPSSGEPH